jgi:hypothetical protein
VRQTQLRRKHTRTHREKERFLHALCDCECVPPFFLASTTVVRFSKFEKPDLSKLENCISFVFSVGYLPAFLGTAGRSSPRNISRHAYALVGRVHECWCPDWSEESILRGLVAVLSPFFRSSENDRPRPRAPQPPAPTPTPTPITNTTCRL